MLTFLAENLKTPLSASIALDRSSAVWVNPCPITTKRDNKTVCSRNVISFSVHFQFRVMRLDLLAVMGLSKPKRYY